MLKEILKNEIKDLIGHVPSASEYNSAMAYVSERLEDCRNLADIATCLYDWRSDMMMQCRGCGDYFLPEEMIENDCGDWFCSSYCEIEFAKEQEYRNEHQRELISTWNE